MESRICELFRFSYSEFFVIFFMEMGIEKITLIGTVTAFTVTNVLAVILIG